MKALAPNFGLNATQLSLLCVQYEIAKPGYGYWTLREMGRPVVKPPLGPPTRSADEMITIEPPPIRQKRSLSVQPTAKPTAPTMAPVAAEVAAQKPAASKSAAAIEAPPPEQPANAPSPPQLHAAAQRTQAKLAAAAARNDGIATIAGKGLFRVSASPAQADRIGLFLSQLAYAVEARGWTIAAGDHALDAVPDGEPLSFEVVEQTDRVAHVQSEKEVAALRRFEEQRARAARTGAYFSEWDKPRIAEWDHVPSGRLTLKFEAGYHQGGLRRSFSDGKRQRLELLTDAILNSFAAYAAGEKAWRVEQERRRLQAIEDEKQRLEAQRRKTLEAKRLDFLNHQMARHESAARVETFIASFGPEALEDQQVAAFLGWATRYATRIRANLSVETLRRKLERHDLMNDAATISHWQEVD